MNKTLAAFSLALALPAAAECDYDPNFLSSVMQNRVVWTTSSTVESVSPSENAQAAVVLQLKLPRYVEGRSCLELRIRADFGKSWINGEYRNRLNGYQQDPFDPSTWHFVVFFSEPSQSDSLQGHIRVRFLVDGEAVVVDGADVYGWFYYPVTLVREVE